MRKDPPIRPPVAVYPPAVARRFTDNTHFIIKPPQLVPANIFQAVHKESSTEELQGNPDIKFFNDPEILKPPNLQAGQVQDPGTHIKNNKRRSLLAEYISQFTVESSPSPEKPQIDKSNAEDLEEWEAAIDDGYFNPDSLLVGNEHQPLYTKLKPNAGDENKQAGSLLAEYLSQPTMKSSMCTSELQSDTEVKETETSGKWEDSSDGGNSSKPERLVSGNGPIGWPSCSIIPQEEPKIDYKNNQTGNLPAAQTLGISEWPTPLCIKRPRPSQDSPDMVFDCGEYMAEVTVESTPSNEELQGDVNQTGVLEQWENAMDQSNDEYGSLLAAMIPASCPPSHRLELTTDSEHNEMESLLEGSQVEREQSAENISAQESTEEEDVDLFDTLGALKRKGICYPWLIKCPAPYCNKVGPYRGMDNHYMMVHANTAIVDETPYFKFLRTK